MQNFIHTLGIERFKSIRSLSIDCKRINVFVGAPNVGKSNILEALALFGLTKPHISKGGLQDLVRFETVDNLFYDNRRNEVCTVSADEFMYQIRYSASEHRYWWYVGHEKVIVANSDMLKELFHDPNHNSIENQFRHQLHTQVTEDSKAQKPFIIPAIASLEQDGKNMNLSNIYPSRIRKYSFPLQPQFDKSFNDYLLPVFGQNLFSVLEKNRELLNLVAPLFHSYGLNLYWDDNKYVLAKTIDGALRKYPFSLIADTLQRIIFYLAAIHTNHGSVLIFEEPETHLYAAYIQNLADSIIASEYNQFFLATHSPYLLQHLMENTPEHDIAVFAVSFDTKEYTTKARTLSYQEIRDIVSYGTDVFFNMERYIDVESSSNGALVFDGDGMVAA